MAVSKTVEGTYSVKNYSTLSRLRAEFIAV